MATVELELMVYKGVNFNKNVMRTFTEIKLKEKVTVTDLKNIINEFKNRIVTPEM